MDAQESQIYNAILIAIIVIGSIISYFVISIIRQQKKVVAIQRQNISAEVTALEQDRARIANDLHDELAPMLVAIKMRINSFELVEMDDQQQLHITNEAIDDMARKMRAISFDLMPNTLQVKGIKKALIEFSNHINKSHHLKLILVLPEESLRIDDQKAIHIYRIIQEIVHNTIKHAGANELVITLKKNKSSLWIQSKDNGKGFDFDRVIKENTGLGLRSLLNRVNLLRGSFIKEGEFGSGTVYSLEIPIVYEPEL